jgi:hypothetical protein
MAVNVFFMRLTHKFLLLIAPAFLVACISAQPYPSGVSLNQPLSPPLVRPPQVGQEWVYNVRNVFNKEIVDVVTERVVSVGSRVKIAREGVKLGQLPDEIQEPWGYILQDPHWSPPQKFLQPMPLWPLELVNGWSGFYSNRYQVVGYPENDYYWGLSITARRWERVKVVAGEFNVLLYQNEIPLFTSDDFARIANIRTEDVWFSPEIGRWVIRRSAGQYLWSGMSWGGALMEDYLEWELISWK